MSAPTSEGLGLPRGLVARLRRVHPWLLVGAVPLLTVAAAALLAPWISPYAPDAIALDRALEGSSARHLMGTDENGRDVLTLLLWGARVALIVGLSTVAISVSVGTLVGAIAGWGSDRVDALLMRCTEVVMSFPGILLAILLLFITREPGLPAVVFALSATGWAGYARLVRGQVLVEREREWVEACRALGLRGPRILVRHVLPNCMGPVVVQATFGLAGAILAEAALSFLGLGPQGTPSWGALLDQGAMYFLVAPHLAIWPGVAIACTVLGVNFTGDALRDMLDPRHRSGRG
jgi:peptide/nickel transport system permease protein